MADRKAQINGIEMYWQESGSGSPLLLIHGFPLSSWMWQPQLEYFSKNGWKVIAPDLRGFGKSEILPGDLNSVNRLAEDVAALLDYLQVEKAVVIGFSLGGYVTFALYRLFPEKVRALILADTKSEADPPEARDNRYKLLEAVRAKGSSAAAEGMVPKLFAPETYQENPDLVAELSGVIERTNPATIIATLPGLAERPDVTPLISSIRVPALVIHGTDDQLMPVAKAKEMAKAIPDWQFSAVPHAGHMSNLENPEFFNRAVESFLKELK